MEIGVNAGITPFVAVGNRYLRNMARESTPMQYMSAKFSFYADKGWWIGAGVDAFSTTFRVTDGVNYIGKPIITEATYNSIAPYLFLNKHIRSGKNTIYAGASAGICPGWYRSEYIDHPPPLYGSWNDVKRANGYNGIYAGLQGGYTYNVTKHLGINAEAGAKFVNMSGTGASLATFPVSVGVRYHW